MFANLQRLSLVPSTYFTWSHYLFQLDKTMNMLERYLREMAAQRRPLFNLHSQIQFDLPPSNFTPVHQPLDLPLTRSPLTLQYLDQYANMFGKPEEDPIPTWSPISWLLEDYGLS